MKVHRFLFFAICIFLFILPLELNAQCNTQDCVWPGDANNDGISNNHDLLFIGLCYDEDYLGVFREEWGMDWTGYEAEDWPLSLPNGLNYKYADLNGDGYIDHFDAMGILANYDSTNLFYVPPVDQYLPGDDLFLVFEDTIFNPGQQVHVEIHLGSADNIIENIHGVAFSIFLDTANIQNLVNINPHGGWINGEDTTIAVAKWLPGITDHLDMAISRIDQMPVSGYGEIAAFDIVITDDIIGIKEQALAAFKSNVLTNLHLEFRNVLGLDENAADLEIAWKNDSIWLTDEWIVNQTPGPKRGRKNRVSIFPNPCADNVTISFEQEPASEITLYNAQGVPVMHKTRRNASFHFPLDNLPGGVYWLSCRFSNTIQMKSMIVQK